MKRKPRIYPRVEIHCKNGCGATWSVLKPRSRQVSFTGICQSCTNRKSAKKHGGCGTKEYSCWKSMKSRVKDKNKMYLTRGIKICKRWCDFENFLIDMGSRPSEKHSIDRINNDGDYEPGNCRWATHSEQVSNTSRNLFISAFGETKTASQWSRDERCKCPLSAITRRIKSGWSHEVAIATASRVKNKPKKPCTFTP